MKKIIIIILAVTIGFLIFDKKNNSQKIDLEKPNYNSYVNSFDDNNENLDNHILNKINEINSKIRSILYEDVELTIIRKGKSYVLNGNLVYLKERMFRLYLWNVNGLVADIGSNKNEFWFWGIGEPLYFGKIDSKASDMLKKPLNPKNIVKFLGVNEIRGQEIKKINDTIAIVDENFVTFVKNDKVVGHQLLINGEIAASTSIEYKEGLPHIISIQWPKEDVYLKFVLNNGQINENISSKNFTKPQKENQVNLNLSLSS